MRRSPVPLLVCMLALVTAIALLRAEAVLTVDTPALVPVRTDANKDAVRRFYDALNVALATGNLAPLVDIIAPDFVEHTPRPGLSPDRASLERELTALHAAAPGLRLAVPTVLADGDQVVAQVEEAHGPAAFLGLPLPPRSTLWGAVDRFRVEGGRIAEHWGTGQRGWLEPLAWAPLHLHPSAWRAGTLERRTITPGEGADVRTAGPRVLVMETGRLTIAVAATSPAVPGVVRWVSGMTAAWDAEPTAQSVPPGTELTLTPGQVLLFAQGTAATIRNMGRTDAVTLEVTMERPGTADAFSISQPTANAPNPVDVVRQPLAGGVVAPLPVGDAVVAIGRIVLNPGAQMPGRAMAGGGLLAVEAGTLDMTISGGRAWGRLGSAGPSELGPATTLAPGAGAFIEPGSVAAFRNGGDAPLVLLVATFLPTSPVAATPVAAARG